jgi:hypothetical protein
MEQTAVEYLIEQLFPKALSEEQYYHIEKAKEMEKQQIIESGDSCSMKTLLYRDELGKMTLDELLKHLVEDTTPTFGEQYYNKTFKNK